MMEASAVELTALAALHVELVQGNYIDYEWQQQQ